MSKSYFLIEAPESGSPLAPSDRWLQAFPGGQRVDANTLLAIVRPGDTVWIPVTHPQWLEVLQQLHRTQGAAAAVVLSPVPNDAEGLRALDAGARGYLHLLAVPAVLREVEQVVCHGGLWVGLELMQRLLTATRHVLEQAPHIAKVVDLSVLSEREAQVARAVAAGKSNREVAEQLCISERTVKAHLGQVFDKLGVRDRLQLALCLAGATATPRGVTAEGPT